MKKYILTRKYIVEAKNQTTAEAILRDCENEIIYLSEETIEEL